METSERKMFLNPKRMKILAGIVFILVFAAVLDALHPVSGFSMKLPAKDYYDLNLDIIATAVERYHNETGSLPEILYGGDSYSINHSKLSNSGIDDPLISKGIISSYPENACMNLDAKKSLISFRMAYPETTPMFGKNGRVICNAAAVNSEILREHLEKSKSYPFTDHFIYSAPDSDSEFAILIICDPAKVTEDFSKHLSETENYMIDIEIAPLINEFFKGKFPLYGYNCRLVDGVWVRKTVKSGV